VLGADGQAVLAKWGFLPPPATAAAPAALADGYAHGSH
jgi:hypothetical protein